MDIAKERQPYRPPQITRVVLRQEQAILSQCSTMASDPRDLPGGMNCNSVTDNCKSWASQDGQDGGARPS